MEVVLRVPLEVAPEQVRRLEALQAAFARVCNALAPLVQSTRVWNRVALHHMAYKQLREQFPQMGSQMVCNAIYSVSRTSRLVFQHPASPFHLDRLGERPLPLLRFTDRSPVYFDRHTLSLKGRLLSMFTLDGRMRFEVQLGARDEARFHTHKLREIVLMRGVRHYELTFIFAAEEAESARPDTDAPEPDALAEGMAAAPHLPARGEIPEYVIVEHAE